MQYVKIAVLVLIISKWLLYLKKWRSFYDEFFLSDDFLFHKIFHYQCKNNNLSVHFRAVLLISQLIFKKLKCWFKVCFHSIFEFNPVKNSNNHFLVSRKDFPRVWEVHRLIEYWFYVMYQIEINPVKCITVFFKWVYAVFFLLIR